MGRFISPELCTPPQTGYRQASAVTVSSDRMPNAQMAEATKVNEQERRDTNQRNLDILTQGGTQVCKGFFYSKRKRLFGTYIKKSPITHSKKAGERSVHAE